MRDSENQGWGKREEGIRDLRVFRVLRFGVLGFRLEPETPSPWHAPDPKSLSPKPQTLNPHP